MLPYVDARLLRAEAWQATRWLYSFGEPIPRLRGSGCDSRHRPESYSRSVASRMAILAHAQWSTWNGSRDGGRNRAKRSSTRSWVAAPWPLQPGNTGESSSASKSTDSGSILRVSELPPPRRDGPLFDVAPAQSDDGPLMALRDRIRGAIDGWRGSAVTSTTVGSVRSTPRNKPIGYTTAPPAARQTWELHKIREESRQLAITNPYLRAYLEWAKVHVVGAGPIPLIMDVPREERERLREAVRWWRRRWKRHQALPLGSRMQNLSELEAQALHHQIVDGDSFIVPYNDRMGLKYQLYAGDALAEYSQVWAGGFGRGRQKAAGARGGSRREGQPDPVLFRRLRRLPHSSATRRNMPKRTPGRSRRRASGTSWTAGWTARRFAAGRRSAPPTTTSPASTRRSRRSCAR